MKIYFLGFIFFSIAAISCTKSTLVSAESGVSGRVADIKIFSNTNWQNRNDSIYFSIKMVGHTSNGDTYVLQDTLIHATTLAQLPTQANAISFIKTIDKNMNDDISIKILYYMPGIGISWNVSKWDKNEQHKQIDFDFK